VGGGGKSRERQKDNGNRLAMLEAVGVTKLDRNCLDRRQRRQYEQMMSQISRQQLYSGMVCYSVCRLVQRSIHLHYTLQQAYSPLWLVLAGIETKADW